MNQNTLQQRISESVALIKLSDTAIYDPDAPPNPGVVASPVAFDDNIDNNERQGQDNMLKCSIFRGGGPGEYVYGWTPFASVTRRDNATHTLKLRVSAASGVDAGAIYRRVDLRHTGKQQVSRGARTMGNGAREA